MHKSAITWLALLQPAFSWVREDGAGKVPAMGWNSWNAYHCDVDAEKIMAAANAMVHRGFKDAGYNYVNSDDCWSNHNGRDNTSRSIKSKLSLGLLVAIKCKSQTCMD